MRAGGLAPCGMIAAIVGWVIGLVLCIWLETK